MNLLGATHKGILDKAQDSTGTAPILRKWFNPGAKSFDTFIFHKLESIQREQFSGIAKSHPDGEIGTSQKCR